MKGLRAELTAAAARKTQTTILRFPFGGAALRSAGDHVPCSSASGHGLIGVDLLPHGSGLTDVWEQPPVPSWAPLRSNDKYISGWLDRFSALRAMWATATDEEFAAMENHIRIADFPETGKRWAAKWALPMRKNC
jgi:hypothetical protein